MKNRWVALAVIFLSFIQFTLNWFDIIPCFGPLIGQMHITLPDIGAIIGLFILGYGLAHIPGGFINEQFGMRNAMLLGIAVETCGTVVTALAPDLQTLLIGRFVCGVGGSIYIGSAIGVTTAWFRGKELATATGLITGVAFTLGAAIGIYIWGDVVTAFGWGHAMLLGAAAGLLTLVLVLLAFPVPPAEAGEVVSGHHLDANSLRRVFGNGSLWLAGVAMMGGYGAYFTAVNLLGEYAQHQLALAPAAAAGLGTILLLAGIPGAFFGGWLADKVFGVMPTFIGGCLVEAAALLLIPHVGFAGLQVCAAVIGFTLISSFVVWVSIPGLYSTQLRISDIPTAAGLMLTIAAIGGFGVPVLYGHIAASLGFADAWVFAGLATIATTCLGFAVKRAR